MRNIATNEELAIAGGRIYETLSPWTPIDGKRRSWDMARIADMLTAASIREAEARNAAIRAARLRRAVIGAGAGEIIDAGGGDDGVVGGTLIGAAFGHISTPGPVEPMARIGLVFLDGETLSLEVNAEEFTLIQTAAAAASQEPTEDPDAPSHRDDEITPEEARTILTERAATQASAAGIATCIAGGGGVFIGAVVTSAGSEFSGALGSVMMAVGAAPALVGAALIILGLRRLVRSLPQDAAMSAGERELFARMKSSPA